MVLVAEAVGQALAAHGVRCVFGLIGSGNFAVSNALVAAGARFVAARHEGAAVSMTDAYSQLTGEIGVCTVHQGPGLTNTMTGLTEASKSRTPMLVLAADTAASALRSNFRIGQDQLVQSVGATAERIHNPRTAVGDALRALHRTRTERRPVVLMLPLDIQAQPVPDDAVDTPARAALAPPRPASSSIMRAVDVLSQARYPLIIAGRGARDAGARADLEALADRLGGLLATSAVGSGLFAGNPWSLGISGGFASPVASRLIEQADVVIGAGAGLNMWTTRHGHLVHPAATVIQIDHHPDAIGAHHRVDLALLGDVREAARGLHDELGRREYAGSGWRTPALADEIAGGAWQVRPFDDGSQSETIDPRTLSLALDRLLPTERTVALDSGHFMGYPAMYLRLPDEHAFVFTQSFQSVGLGLGSAIGAAVARPDRLTVAALGDGGALMSLGDLETVARLRLRMVVVIYNDSAYGAEVHHFGPDGHALDLVRFPDVNFAALGRAVGLRGVTVRRVEDLETVRGWLAEGGQPALVIDAKVVPTIVAEWLEEAFRGH
jgi:thiamine pyrophosphate-dependent acetolactate synthase large subunit-like protein